MLRINLYREEEHETGQRGRWLRSLQEGGSYTFLTDEMATIGYWVHNPVSGETYQVSLESCTCPDATYNGGLRCKHQLALANRLALGTLFKKEM